MAYILCRLGFNLIELLMLLVVRVHDAVPDLTVP